MSVAPYWCIKYKSHSSYGLYLPAKKINRPQYNHIYRKNVMGFAPPKLYSVCAKASFTQVTWKLHNTDIKQDMCITCMACAYHMHTTRVSHAHYMVSNAHHMGIKCTPHGYQMHTTWVSHAHHMGITCTTHGITCTPHVCHMYTSGYHMHTIWTWKFHKHWHTENKTWNKTEHQQPWQRHDANCVEVAILFT